MDPEQQANHEAIARRVDRSDPNRRMTKEERIKRAQEMHALYIGPPGLTLEAVGRKYGGLSKERIRQIFNEFNLAVRNPRPYGRTKESHSPMVETLSESPQVEIPETTAVITQDLGDLVYITCVCGVTDIAWVAQCGPVACGNCGRRYDIETKLVEVK